MTLIVFLIIYILIIIFSCIWIKFGKSFEDVQYYTTSLLNEDWPKTHLTTKNFFKYSQENALNLLYCCVLSSVVYSNPLNFKKEVYFNEIYHLKGLSFSRTKQTFGFIAVCNDFFILSLKSTSNLNDIYVSSHTNMLDTDDGEIHQGYYTQSIELLPEIYNILIKYKNINKIFICGHSLGGTIGSVIGYLIAKNINFYNVCVYNYASVKFGNKNLKYNIEKMKNLKIFNIINKADLVVHKPLSCFRIGDTIEHRIDTGNDNINHGIKAYRECILNVKDSKIPRRNHRMNENLFRLVLDFIG